MALEIRTLSHHEQVEFITTLVWNEALGDEVFDYTETLEFLGYCVTKMLIPRQDREGL